MTSTRAIALLAAFVCTSAVTTAASAYFPSQFRLAEMQTQETDTSSSSTSSSQASAIPTPASSDASSVVLFQPVSGSYSSEQLAEAACMQQAANKRENIISDAFAAYYSDVSAALRQRQTMIVDAYNNPDQNAQRQLLLAIWHSFGRYWQVSDEALHGVIRNAWNQYQTDRHHCGLTGYDPELGGLGSDAQF